MAKDRIETPAGSTGAQYLDGLAAVLVRRKLIKGGEPGCYVITCSAQVRPVMPYSDGLCGAGIAGQSPRAVVDSMAAYGWGVSVKGNGLVVVCREHSK